MAASIPPVPASFKPLHHYIKTAAEHDSREPVVAYYCRLYGLQKGMEIDRKSPDCRNFLAALMNILEETKKQLQDVEAIQNEIVGQAHLENYALKLFLYADNEDRAARFGKNVIKSFYTAGMLMDVLTTFGPVSEDIEKNRKYAKWKAAYIHNCLKNGETPISGPLPDDEEFGEAGAAGSLGDAAEDAEMPGPSDASFPQQPSAAPRGPSPAPRGSVPGAGFSQPPADQGTMPGFTQPQPWSGGPSYNSYPAAAPRSQPPAAAYSQPVPQVSVPQQPTGSHGGAVALKPEDYARAMKLCKFATSALQYEDPKTAVENLSKAISLLTTGQE